MHGDDRSIGKLFENSNPFEIGLATEVGRCLKVIRIPDSYAPRQPKMHGERRSVSGAEHVERIDKRSFEHE